jgi:hypothetical protein
MATRWYITPYDPVHWKDEHSSGVESELVVNVWDFSQQARAKWPSYQDYPIHSWDIIEDGVEISGNFDGKGFQILTLEGTGNLFNQFVTWYRTYIPAKHKLFLFIEGSWDSLELVDGITDDDVGQFAGFGR